MSKPENDREIAGQWITIENFKNYSALANSLTDLTGDHILGYVYIDHAAGLTLDIIKLFNRNDHKIEFTDTLRDKELRVIIRHAQFSETSYQVVKGDSFGDYELVKPSHLESYDRDDLTNFRNDEALDSFRAPGFPDDIQILLIQDDEDSRPELVWGRIEKYTRSNHTGICHLMVQPHQNFGINKNDALAFALTELEDKMWLLGLIENPKVKDKPWWKIW
jgi:hypothetical protein